MSEQALPTDAIADRSTKFARTRTRAAVTSSPPCLPSLSEARGTEETARSRPARPSGSADAKSVAFVAPAVAISAATAISVKPASPRDGRAASAIAVSP